MYNRIVVVAAAGVSLVVLASPAGRPANVAVTSLPVETSAAERPVEAVGDTTGRAPRGQQLLEALLGRPLVSGGANVGAPDSLTDVLIATLPDPVNSHLDWRWDSHLESVRRAFETSGFIVDRFWIPPLVDASSSAKGGTLVRDSPLREEPGVLLFRGTGARRQELKLLYLVGEVPTGGIHKKAFQVALDDREKLLELRGIAHDTAAARTLRIIGPTFSGSVRSLQHLLARRADTTGNVVIVSGTATSPGNRAALECGLPRVRFAATVHSDSTLLAALATHVLKPLGLPRRQVAILQEGSTQYGASFFELSGEFLTVPFPMSISSLRTEYHQFPDPRRPAAPIPGTALPRIPLDLIDPARPSEDLPVTSRLTPAALDLVLDDIARTLSANHVRLVGLLATDVRDKLFLAAELKKRMRDIQFFTFESNVLYLRSDWNTSLRGMLVLTTYPLILENQAWSGTSQTSRRFAFTSDAAEGVYNATLMQLENHSQLLEYRSPITTDSLGQPPVWITTVGSHAFLPIRVVPGRGSAYVASSAAHPQAAARQDSTQCRTAPAPAQTELPLRHTRPTPAFGMLGGMLIALASLVSLGIAALTFWPSLFRPDERSGTRPLAETNSAPEIYAEVEQGSLAIHEELYAALLIVAFGGILLPVAAVLAVSRPGQGTGTRSLAFVLTIVLVIGALAAAVRAGRAWSRVRSALKVGVDYLVHRQWNSRRQRLLWGVEIAGRFIVALAGAGYGLLLIWFALQIHNLDGPAGLRELFAYRASQVGSLVSPVLPLVLGAAGFAMWCLWHIQRIRLLQGRPLFEQCCSAGDCGCAGEPDDVFAVCDRVVATALARVRSRLFLIMPTPAGPLLFLVLAAGALWLYCRFGRSLESLVLGAGEGGRSSFEVLFAAGIAAALVATVWAVYRMIAVWKGLEDCLEHINVTPLAAAFERVPPHLARLTQIRLSAAGCEELATATPAGAAEAPAMLPLHLVAARLWNHLVHIYRKAEAEADPAPAAPAEPVTVVSEAKSLGIAGLEDRLDALMRLSAPDPRDGVGGKTLAQLHRVLRDLWRQEPGTAEVRMLLTALTKEVGKVDDSPAGGTSSKIRRTFTTPLRLWLREAEDYAALQVVDYVGWVTRHLRVLAIFLLASLLLTTALVSTYPFYPQSVVRLVFFFVLLGTIASLVFVISQMNRNEVLSRITQTEPGRITWDTTFVLNLITFGVIPLLALLSSELPGLRSALFAWTEPVIKALARQ